MKIGMNIRNWGPTATPEIIAGCARVADDSTLDSIWINDHVALPAGDWNNEYGIPDDMGDILDPMGVLTFFAGITQRIALGTGVLIAPYRPPLLTAKWLATIQVLSGDRFLMGVGPGYLTEEFKALGVPKSRRGRITDETLAFVREAFASEVIESNGQPVYFKPRPARPPLYIGGSPDVAIPRAVKLGEGWIPVMQTPEDLKAQIARMNSMAEEAGRGRLGTIMMKTLPLDDRNAAIEMAQAYKDSGVDHLVHTQGVAGVSEFADVVGVLTSDIRPAMNPS